MKDKTILKFGIVVACGATSILLINYFTQAALGCIAFYLSQSHGFWQAWFWLWTILGGYIIPVQLMPESVRDIAMWLPFRAAFGIPTEIASGLLTGGEAWAADQTHDWGG